MKISGFTMVRNATRLCYPVKESIASILPLVDEFIVALGKGDEEDRTEEEILSLHSPKIKIIPRIWDKNLFLNSEIFRHETNVALKECTGDWCFYIQADEVVHEDDLPYIYNVCEQSLSDREVEGILFRYLHFWGDYNHYLPFHNWYRNEIRIIRNHTSIESVKDAQSFRMGNRKLKVVATKARIFHYGWVRPPQMMKTKKTEHDNIHRGKSELLTVEDYFDYGNMSTIPVYNGTHPAVMTEKIKHLNWQHLLRSSGKGRSRNLLKHEKWHYRVVSWFENRILNGRQLWGYSNWKVIRQK